MNDREWYFEGLSVRFGRHFISVNSTISHLLKEVAWCFEEDNVVANLRGVFEFHCTYIVSRSLIGPVTVCSPVN